MIIIIIIIIISVFVVCRRLLLLLLHDFVSASREFCENKNLMFVSFLENRKKCIYIYIYHLKSIQVSRNNISSFILLHSLEPCAIILKLYLIFIDLFY